MPDENPICAERDYDALELDMLHLLTTPDRYPTVWSAADLGRQIETGDPDAVVRPLRGAGLLHQTSDGFVFATPAAYRMVALVGHVI